jgi:hypothetical protein
MKIINAQIAVNYINDAISEMDLDDLARLVTNLTNMQRVIVIDDGLIIPDEIDNPLRDLVQDGTIGVSDVFTNGIPVGFVDENGQISEFEPRYTEQTALNEQDQKTTLAHPENKNLVPIYDENAGKLVCYADPAYVKQILSCLERT